MYSGLDCCLTPQTYPGANDGGGANANTQSGAFVCPCGVAGRGGLTYLAHRIGEQRITVQDSWISSGEEKGYRAYGDVAGSELDSIATDAADRDTLAAR